MYMYGILFMLLPIPSIASYNCKNDVSFQLVYELFLLF